MRILFVTPEYPPYVWGGLGRYSREIVPVLRRRAHVDVLHIPVYYGYEGTRRPLPDGISCIDGDDGRVIHAASPEAARYLSAGGPLDRVAQSAYACILPEVADMLEPPYDFIYAQDFYTAPFAVGLLHDQFARHLACMSHLPVYAGFTYFEKPFADEMHQALEALCVRLSEVVIVPSSFAKRVVQATHCVSADRIVVAGEGVRLRDGPRRDGNRGAADNPLRVLSVARLVEQKGWHLTASVLQMLDDAGVRFKFTMVGDGPVEAYLDALGLRDAPYVTHIPTLDQEDVFDLYERAHVLLSTSLYETFGLTVLEAMSRGCVPATFRLPVLFELLGDGGITVEVGDSRRLASEIADLAVDRARLDRLSRAVEARAASFSWEHHADAVAGALVARS